MKGSWFRLVFFIVFKRVIWANFSQTISLYLDFPRLHYWWWESFRNVGFGHQHCKCNLEWSIGLESWCLFTMRRYYCWGVDWIHLLELSWTFLLIWRFSLCQLIMLFSLRVFLVYFVKSWYDFIYLFVWSILFYLL